MMQATTPCGQPDLVSIVVPFFNEADGIELFQHTLRPILDSQPQLRFEVICVDDGSRDGTLDLLLALSRLDRRFRVIELSRNFGKEAALTAGIDAASGDAVIPIDADLQDPPELIAALIAEWRRGYDVVLARRVDRSADSYLKRTTASLFYKVHNQISTIKVPQDVGDYRLMSRAAIEALKQLPENQRFMKGLFAWVGFRSTTIDYVRHARSRGETKFSGWRLWNFAIDGVTSFSTAPLKVWTYIGGAGAALSLCYAAFIVLRTLILGVDVPGFASLLVAILFLGSLQLISIGVLGEYIGRIYLETKRRPTYIVRQRHGDEHEP
ncbi:glycosyltransferase family 2 protein [Rugamonas fusca]|nr:glycosyltransferase family 2 protein [Rugamonas fusca]